MKIRIIALFFLLVSQELFALTFSIVPKGTLPDEVPLLGKVSAYYTVSNTTASSLSGNFVKTLPQNVTQVTCDPKYCDETFSLGADGSSTSSCILKLTIKGPVTGTPSDLLVCTTAGTNCDGTSALLNVHQVDSVPFVGIAACRNTDSLVSFPSAAGRNEQSALKFRIYGRAQVFKNRSWIRPCFAFILA